MEIIGIALGFACGFIFGGMAIYAFSIKHKSNQTNQLTKKATLLEEAYKRNEELELRLEKLSDQLDSAKEQNVELSVNLKSSDEIKRQLKLEFETLAGKIFEEKNDRFKLQSKEQIQHTLEPFKERLEDFRKTFQDAMAKSSKDHFSLKDEIKGFLEAGEIMGERVDSLTSALKGDSKTQGNWGEITLERLLENSGLRKDDDYVLQPQYKSNEGDSKKYLRPDAIIKLPENKNVIIDAKVSFTNYEQLFSEEVAKDEQKKQHHIKLFLASVKRHVDELAERGYENIDNLKSPDFVLMFMPIEAAFALAMHENRNLQNYAWEKRVVIVSPTLLFVTLKTIASVWRNERYNRNADEIAKRGGLLYDKFAVFIKKMGKIGSQLTTVTESYDDAMKTASGKGGVISQIKNLEKLGAKTSKKLDENLLSEIPNAEILESKIHDNIEENTEKENTGQNTEENKEEILETEE